MDVREAWEGQSALLKLTPYPDAQHRHFARFQNQTVTVLEIGVLFGGSLRMWRTYFGDGATIVGVDIDPRCVHADDPEQGIHVRIGDQSDPRFLEELAREFGPFDIVIDDGGHTMEQQIATFETLYPHVSPNGVFVCEDSFSSYVDAFGGNRPGTFIDLAKAKIDEMHQWFDTPPPTQFTRSTVSIHFYLGLVVFERTPVEAPEIMVVNGEGIDYLPLEDVKHR